jgi:membrane fusion protein (multidrug efflux system)
MLIAALLGACGGREAGNAAAVVTTAPATDVVTAPVTRQPLSTTVEAVGTARARESVNVTTKASNIVTAIAFREGEPVRRGQVLVELDGAEARAALAEAEAALIDSESQFRRSRNLYAQQALSVAQLDQIEATLKANSARVDAARARLADTTIRAGFDGRTGLRQVSVGSLVSPGTVITTLDDASVIKLEFTVPETYLHMLRLGQGVTATTAGLPGARFTGTLTTLDSRIDPVTRAIAVRAEIPNRDGALRPGMFMTVTLAGDPAPALLVPEAAIVPEQGHAYVFAVADGVVARREVRTGRRRPGEVEVVSGLADGERVVVEGTQMLRDGDSVRESPGTAPVAAAAP